MPKISFAPASPINVRRPRSDQVVPWADEAIDTVGPSERQSQGKINGDGKPATEVDEAVSAAAPTGVDDVVHGGLGGDEFEPGSDSGGDVGRLAPRSARRPPGLSSRTRAASKTAALATATGRAAARYIPSMLSRLAVVAVGTAVVAAVGCGGGAGGEGLSRQEFIQEAEAICKRAQSESDALAEPQTDADVIDFGEQNVSILERVISDLGELEPPPELKAAVEGWLALADRQATTGGDLIEGFREQDEAQRQELVTQLEETEQQADALAAKIGMGACGVD